jgi:predicted anti-sigma-YlaC factor YlaD
MSEISHQRAKNLIQGTMGGSITQLEKENLARHLGSCAACRAYASQMDALEGSLRRSFQARWDSTRGPSARVVETIYRKTRVHLMHQKISGFATSAIAMGVLAVIAIFALSIRSMQSAPLSGGPHANPNIYPCAHPDTCACHHHAYDYNFWAG